MLFIFFFCDIKEILTIIVLNNLYNNCGDSMYNILICDDEKDIVKALRIYLSENSEYNLLEAENGQRAWEIIEEGNIQLLLLDIMMPVMDGLTLLKRLRTSGNNVPVILLTAKSESEDIISGLNVGADDYITKPFNAKEVLARVSSALRRYTKLGGQSDEKDIYTYLDLKMDDNQKVVEVLDQKVNLTPTEYGILKLLLQNQGKVLSTAQIYEGVWKETAFGNEQSIAVHIRHLREKIEVNPSDPRYIRVVWGQGYCIRKDDKND